MCDFPGKFYVTNWMQVATKASDYFINQKVRRSSTANVDDELKETPPNEQTLKI